MRVGMDYVSLNPPRAPLRSHALVAFVTRPGVLLGAIMTLGVFARLATAWRHTSPRTFPDEYIYASLARSIAMGDGLSIRGTSASFPALLEPLLAAPTWLTGDPIAAFRLTQGLHVVAMSLAAIPVYWMARRVGAAPWQAVACGAYTIALPSMLFTSYITADAVAFPLALGAAAVGVAAVDRPRRLNQVGFVTFAALATLTRVQYVIVPVAFAVAALVLEEGRPLRAVRRYRWTFVPLAVPALAAIAVGPGRVLGYYRGVLDSSIQPTVIAHWLAVDGMLIAYAGGVALVPAAVAGLSLGIRRSAIRRHRAFAAFAATMCVLLLGEAALYASNGSQRFQERYLITILPLLAVAFCVGVARLPAGGLLMLAVSATLVAVSLFIPLSGYTVLDGKQDSPFLMSVARAEEILGIGSGSLAVAAAAGMLALAAVLVVLRPRLGVPIAMCAGIAAVTAASVGATSFDFRAAQRMQFTFADNGRWTWADDLQLGKGAVLVTPGADRTAAAAHIFWNRDYDRLLRMPRGPSIDTYGDEPAMIARDGRLVAAGRPVGGPLLVEESYALVTFSRAMLARRVRGAKLWLLEPGTRVTSLTVGRYVDGWLDTKAEVTVWPRSDTPPRAVELRLSLPDGLPAAKLDLSAPGFERRVVVAPGTTVVVRIPVEAPNGPFTLHMTGRTAIVSGGRQLVAQLAEPRLVSAVPSTEPAA